MCFGSHPKPGPSHGAHGDDVAASALADGRSHLAGVLEYFSIHSRSQGPVSTEVATGTNVEAAIAALTWRPDELAIVGSSRLARPSTIFLGITAHRMLHSLPVPLIVVPNTSTEPHT